MKTQPNWITIGKHNKDIMYPVLNLVTGEVEKNKHGIYVLDNLPDIFELVATSSGSQAEYDQENKSWIIAYEDHWQFHDDKLPIEVPIPDKFIDQVITNQTLKRLQQN